MGDVNGRFRESRLAEHAANETIDIASRLLADPSPAHEALSSRTPARPSALFSSWESFEKLSDIAANPERLLSDLVRGLVHGAREARELHGESLVESD